MTVVSRLRWPPEADVPFVVAAGGVWLGLLLAPGSGRTQATMISAVVLGVAGVAFAVRRRYRAVLMIATAGVVTGAIAGALNGSATQAIHEARLPVGPVDVVAVVLDDPFEEDFGWAVTVDVLDIGPTSSGHEDPVRLVLRGAELALRPGDVVRIEDVHVFRRPGWHRGRPITGSIGNVTPEVVGSASPPYLRLGNVLRNRVIEALDSRDSQAEALTRGLLIGDTSLLGAVETEELRRAGLTHFVAVSGGNVALFLGGMWILLMPLPVSSKTRAIMGAVALTVFVAMTRWEPSVLRAAAMAGAVLLGRIVGIPVDPWRAVGVGVAGALLLAPPLVSSVGFQLSVSATCGLLLAAGLGAGRRPAWLWRGLVASTAAQVAVLPLLISVFGTVPLLAPAANVVAAPLVSLATIMSGLGTVVGLEAVVDIGVSVAGLVLRVASVAALGPQLGAGGVVMAVLVGVLVVGRATRSIGVAAVVVAILAAAPTAGTLATDAVAVLDVGQGDAVLIRGGDGALVGVDTGPDPVAYLEALRRNRVDQMDVLILTHGDEDHVGGAADLLRRVPVGEVWIPRRDPAVPAVESIVDIAETLGVPVRRPIVGELRSVGGVLLEVLGPARRYDAENDESTVLWVSGEGRTMLLAGDVEAVAQRELPSMRPDVLLVPHHGSATTDLRWLASTVGGVAIVSVGENRYGHPSPAILDVLEEAGAEVFVTREHGDIIVAMGTEKIASDTVGMVGS